MGEGTDNSRLGRVWRAWHVWVPLLLLLALAAPGTRFMLPATRSHLGENYQPLRALKFAHSRGRDFHKWGPLPNVLLAPEYGATIGWWALRGSFENPGDEFPYGFKDPMRQLSVLIFQGRVLFLVLGLLLLGVFIVDLRFVTSHRGAVFLAVTFCLATNHVVVNFLANTRPDGPMLAFAAAALAVYFRMLAVGPTVRQGVVLSLLAVAAISCKELAATLFVLPYLGLAWHGWRTGRDDPARQRTVRRAAVGAVTTGVVAYALLNVVYAPATWWQRMSFWLTGDGKDSAIWGGGLGAGGSFTDYLGRIGAAWIDNLGPGGTLVAVAALVALLVARPPRWGYALLPLVSLFGLGLAPMGYVHDRFYLLAALAAVPPVAMGLAILFDRLRDARWRALPAGLTALALLANLNFATFAWHDRAVTSQAPIERHALLRVPDGQTINLLPLHPAVNGTSRFDWLGLSLDPRSAQQLIDAGADRPDWIYTKWSAVRFIEDCERYPRRAEMLRRDAGFEFERWPGIIGLGYRLETEIVPRTPGWFFFDWMPAPRRARESGTVLVYRRVDEAPFRRAGVEPSS